MKINFTQEHKDKIQYYIKEFQNITSEYQIYTNKVKELQAELNTLTAKLQSTESNLQTLRDEEKKYMDELHLIYGDFTLNDLWESL